MPRLMTTCDSCDHWAPDLSPTTLVDAERGRVGTCRERLQLFAWGEPGPNRSLAINHQVYYPAVPAKFPTCGQYRPAVTI